MSFTCTSVPLERAMMTVAPCGVCELSIFAAIEPTRFDHEYDDIGAPDPLPLTHCAATKRRRDLLRHRDASSYPSV
jgi:hypothetical protein